jgi:hypothetical protein
MNAAIEPKVVSRFVLRKRTFEARTMDDVKRILEALRAEKYTGPVVIDMAQGGVHGMSAEDRAALPT